MILRKAELKDKEAIREITNLLYLDIPGFVWNKEDFIEEQIKKGEYFVMSDNGNIAGVMSLRERKNGLHIETLVVDRRYQSKGFGTQFIDFAKNIAKEKGARSLFAYSFPEYNIADFYLKRGFKMMDYVGYYKNRKYNCFAMEL